EWRHMCRDIRACNVFWAKYTEATEVEPGASERLAAEVRVSRALGYSFLTSFFGDVPLGAVPLDIDDPQVYGPGNSQEEVVDFLLKELDEAAAILPEGIPSGDDLGRMNKGAALALKARIALAHGRYQVAEEAAKAVMDMGVYSLFST